MTGEDDSAGDALLPSAAPPPEVPPVVRDDGELQPWELAFRLGSLAAAAFFLVEGQGSPLDRSPLFLAAAFALSALAVITMAMQWRVLGDWRRWTQQVVLLSLAFVLVVPVSAALNPQLGQSALPDGMETVLRETIETINRIPGLSLAWGLVHGVIVFLVTVMTLIVLVAHSGPAQRGGIVFVGLLVAGVGLFFHPTAETVVGLLLLAYFLRVQWETALLVPRRLREHLSAAQLDYLRELARDGALSTGETKLYLEGDARAFSELLDYGLVEFDTIARQVVPGKRLLHDPAVAALEKALGHVRRGLWVLAGVVYFVMPDLIPGPIDDIVVMAICAGAGFNWIGALFGRRK